MRWPKFNAYDFYILLSIIILDFYVLTSWSTFKHCQEPLNMWLLVDYNLMLVYRILFIMKFSGYDDESKFTINVLMYAILLPFMVLWTYLGYIWQENGIDCIPDNMVPWSYLLWLGITGLCTVVLFGTLIYDYTKHRRLKQYMTKMEESFLSSNYSSSSSQL